MRVLETCKLFHGLSDCEVDALKEAARIESIVKGEQIFSEGDSGDGVYIVRTGRIELSVTVGTEERKTLSHRDAGDFFGEMAVLDDSPRSATAVAEEDSTLYFIPRAEMLRSMEASPRLALNLVQEFSRRIRDFNRQYLREVLQAERLAVIGRFARSIVHDLKNPLNTIGIAAELLNTANISSELRQSCGPRIQKQVDRLNRMVTELLEFARDGQMAAVLTAVDYAGYVRELIEEIREDIDRRQVALRFENDPPSIPLNMDPRRLAHVFHNLIHNAVEAMPDGGTVCLRFRQEPDRVVTEIEDTGAGIPPEALPRLFEPFVTFGKAQGTGLGLSICKKIVEDHGGTITARREAGRGAIFAFSLPLHPSPAASQCQAAGASHVPNAARASERVAALPPS